MNEFVDLTGVIECHFDCGAGVCRTCGEYRKIRNLPVTIARSITFVTSCLSRDTLTEKLSIHWCESSEGNTLCLCPSATCYSSTVSLWLWNCFTRRLLGLQRIYWSRPCSFLCQC